MIHKSGDTDQIIHRAVPMVELCIHGGGTAKYGRGVAIVDDTLPAVQRLKLLLTECIDDRDSDSDEDRLADADVDRKDVNCRRKILCWQIFGVIVSKSQTRVLPCV